MMKSLDNERFGAAGAQPAHDRLVLERRVAALHRGQHAVRARLHRQVELAHELVDGGVRVDEPGRHLLRVRRRVADAGDAGNLGHVLEQRGEVRDLRRVPHRSTVRIHVLPEQRDFTHALVGQVGHLREHVVEWPRDFLAARIRHHAERAVLAAALHDRHERRRAVDARGRQVIELLDFGKADVDLRLAGRAPAREQLRQPVQRLRAEHDIDERRAADDGRAFLRRDAAAHPDDQIGLQRLQRAHAAQVVEHALLRLLAHRAGVEQDDVSASSGRAVRVAPSLACSTSAILAESYSFIWQPNVRMYSFFVTAMLKPRSRR